MNKYLEKISGFNIARNLAIGGASAGYEFGSMGAKKGDKVDGGIAGAAVGALSGYNIGKIADRYSHKVTLPKMLGSMALLGGATYATGKLYSKAKDKIKKK